MLATPTETRSDTLLVEGRNCCAIATAERLAVIVDAAAYFDAFRRAAEAAERSILILAWDFNSHTPLNGDGLAVGDFLNELARRRPGLHIRILDWDFPMLFQHDREFPPIYGLGWKPHERVHFRFDDTHPVAGSQHQKIAVIDDRVAFVGGLDLAERRWDTPEHSPRDPRRTVKGTAYPPVHDVMAAMDGEAATVAANIARERWKRATGESLEPSPGAFDVWPETLVPEFRKVRVGIACTAPAAAEGEPEVREIEHLYLDMIARARDYIYIENQYFTSHAVGEALTARLAEPDGPEIVVVTRKLSHGWLEEITMTTLRRRLVKELSQADRHGRFHVYCGHVDGLEPGTCLDIHSKVMIVDDVWLRVGSSNVSNRSMGVDTECDILVEAAGREDVIASIRAVRDRLLGEHLGAAPSAVAAALQERGSLHGAVEALGSGPRTLRTLEEEPESSDATLAVISIADPEQPVSLEKMVDQVAPGVELRPAFVTWKKVLFAAAALLGLAALWRFTPLAGLVNAEGLAARVEALGNHRWAIPLVVLAYTPAAYVVFPRALITVAAVLVFGPWTGFLCAVAGNLIAAFVTYMSGRLMSRDQVRRIVGERVNALADALRQRGLFAITAMRLVPIAPFVAENVVAGAIRIPLADYLLATFLGMLPGEIASALFGAELQDALLGSSPVNPLWILALVAGLALAALGVRRYLMTRAPRRP